MLSGKLGSPLGGLCAVLGPETFTDEDQAAIVAREVAGNAPVVAKGAAGLKRFDVANGHEDEAGIDQGNRHDVTPLVTPRAPSVDT